MNDTVLNEAVLKELKSVVDRAVEPVRATFARKQTMREELLAHLVAIFDEEAERLRDEPAALERARQRFGDPEVLTKQLQQAVPRWDRCWSILENMGYRPSESAWRLALRHFLVMVLIYSLWLPTWMALRHGWRIIWEFIRYPVNPQVILYPVEAQRLIVFIVVGIVLLGALFNVILSIILAPLVNKFGPALASKRSGRVLLAALCVFAVFCGLTPHFIGAAILFLLMARQAVKQWRYQSAWAYSSSL